MEKINNTITKISPIDEQIIPEIQKRLDNLTKPIGSLGYLEEIVKKVCSITGKLSPKVVSKTVFVFAADHGVTQEGVSAYPKEVTSQMVYNFIHGGAGINVIARHVGADVIVVDIGVDKELNIQDEKFKLRKISFGTKNFVKGPAMSKQEAIKSINTGIELVEELLKEKIFHKDEICLIAVGDMGIGNTTSASAITQVVTGKPVEEVTGYGTGIDNKTYQTKIEVIKKAIECNKPNITDGIDILYKLGGYEIGGIAGVILACAANRIPVVIDGFVSAAGALIAATLSCKCIPYMFAGHLSEEPGHKVQLEFLGIKPILNLNMRLGEGTGACLAMSIIEVSCKILNEMATFESAGVTKKM